MMKHAVGAAEPSELPARSSAPHPDDETFGCGGVIAWKCSGIPVGIVFITDGSRSHPNEDPASLAARRRGEGLEAATVLGVSPEDVHFLHESDGSLDALDSAPRRQLVSRLADLFRRYDPGELYVPHHADRHSDHEATYRLAREAITEAGSRPLILQYPIWLIWWGPLSLAYRRDPLRGACRVDVRSVQLPKLARSKRMPLSYLPCRERSSGNLLKDGRSSSPASSRRRPEAPLPTFRCPSILDLLSRSPSPRPLTSSP